MDDEPPPPNIRGRSRRAPRLLTVVEQAEAITWQAAFEAGLTGDQPDD